MPRKKGLFAFVTGIAAGAAAVFLSDAKNRHKTERTVKKAAKAAKKISNDVKKNSRKAAKK